MDMTLTSFFISAPLSAVYTALLGLSMSFVFDEIGRAFFKRNELWFRAMYFFAGLLFVAWIVLLLSLAGLVSVFIFRVLALCFLLSAGYIVYKNHGKPLLPNIIKLFLVEPEQPLVLRFFTYAVLSVVVIFILISLAPPTDADSLDYHLGVPVEILRQGSLWFNKDQVIFRMVGFGEMINLLGVANGCPQLGSFIQVIALIWLLALYSSAVPESSKITLMIMCLGIPLLLWLITSQKHQLTGIICTSICFYGISKEGKLLKEPIYELIIWALLFASGVKYSFIISASAIILFMFLKKQNWVSFGKIIGSFALWGIIFLGPLYIYKLMHFGDPVSPLLEHLHHHPDPVVVALHQLLQHYSESDFAFPLNLLVPSSIGNISTVLGLGSVVILCFLSFYRYFKIEIVVMLFFILLTILGGQKTSRFFVEPYLWILPLFINQADSYRWGRYLLTGGRVQFLLLLPFIFFALYALSPGILSDSQREKLMHLSAFGYAESVWIDEILPSDARIGTNIRSRALLPRPFFPFEYLIFSSLEEQMQANALDDMLKEQYHVNYLILPRDGFEGLKKRYAGKLVAGPKKFFIATRNPFNRTQYELIIYRMK